MFEALRSVVLILTALSQGRGRNSVGDWTSASGGNLIEGREGGTSVVGAVTNPRSTLLSEMTEDREVPLCSWPAPGGVGILIL